MIRLSVILFFVLFFSSPVFADTGPEVVRAVQALADKSDRVVVFFDKSGREIFRAAAAFGQVKGQKTREGDAKTPEGDYTLSLPRPSQEWGWFMPINYPSDKDVAEARARRQNPATLGNHIGMHSVGDGFLRNVRQSFGENWTLGCIAVRERDMEQIRSMTFSPIPIRIQP